MWGPVSLIKAPLRKLSQWLWARAIFGQAELAAGEPEVVGYVLIVAQMYLAEEV